MAYEKKGEYPLAVREYKLAVKEVPLAHLFLGNVYFLQKKYTLAEEHYKHCIRELQDNPEPYNNLAWLYYTQGIKLDEAETLARRAVELAPKNHDAAYQDTLEHILRAKTRGRNQWPGG
ncbi:MAG: tetratricopeptide repeat protein [Deltaproteobacteria bacterium]|nr:tetratricopeptide repeat protein [Deltaproteobacteria bacterium]MBW2308336.1 tetratricopeptide repeat protein [Deltaproteobacteria bacterium]